MGEQESSKREAEWMGCSCPKCHAVFRVPTVSRGKQVECPSCRDLVLIPASEADPSEPGETRRTDQRRKAEEERRQDEDPVASNRFRKMGDEPIPEQLGEGESAKPVRIRKKKIRQVEKKAEGIDWEEGEVRGRSRRGGSRNPAAWTVGVLLALVLVVVIAVSLRDTSGSPDASGEDGGPEPATEANPPMVAGDPSPLPGIEGINMESTIALVDKAVREFLAADTLADLLPLVRGDEEAQTRIRLYYQDRTLERLEVKEVAPSGRILKRGELWSVDVVLADFSVKAIALERIGEAYKVDWESWVGYSEMTWDRFLEERPTTPVLFRVRVEPVSYFNFEFSDEQEWRSFRLEAPDRERRVYGYVPRLSTLAARLTPLGGPARGPVAYTLRLRFPEGATGKDQVLVDSIVAAGWVLGGGGD